MIGPIVKMSDTPLVPENPSPTLGQNNDEILETLGYSVKKIEELRNSGAVGE
jgi:crotonobetainyl-CoA:carnitine CoA-transferase CaiB-like acyl-CoA transferase